MGWENVEIEKEELGKHFFLGKTRGKETEKYPLHDVRIAFTSSKCLFCVAKEALLQGKSATLSNQFRLNW